MLKLDTRLTVLNLHLSFILSSTLFLDRFWVIFEGTFLVTLLFWWPRLPDFAGKGEAGWLLLPRTCAKRYFEFSHLLILWTFHRLLS